MADLGDIEVELLGMDTPEKLLALRQKLDFAKGVLKTLEALYGEKALELVERTGPIDAGEFVYRITTDVSYKAVQKPKEMAQGILEVLSGDWDAFAACLASGAFKHGQLRTLMEEAGMGGRFGEFFERIEKKTVDGKPVKKVCATNKLFSSAR